MIFLYLLIIPLLYVLIRLILYLIVLKFGKFSYDGFSALGFSYNSKKNIFYSTKTAWQKNFGYTHLYDVLAPVFRMILDTEPVKFYYNNKNWLITFWKGQYGIVTGAEIGIYYTEQKNSNRRTVYLPVEDNNMLNMYLKLYKNGEVIAKLNAKHWWLAIFKLGMFSNPKELSMDINITFKNKEMLNAFLESFKKIGYKEEDFKIIDNTFCFKYIKPKTRKVWTRSYLIDKIRQFFNLKNVELYNEYLDSLMDEDYVNDSKSESDKKVIIINNFLPNILKNNINNSETSQQIMKKIINEKHPNLVLLNSHRFNRL